MNKDLSHISHNNQPQMVDVSHKNTSKRTATAQTTILLPDAVKNVLLDGEIQSKKGPVFHTAIIAGVMAAKKTHELIPFCHPLSLENCQVSIETTSDKNIVVKCTCNIHSKTGVEMEALTGASVAALTVYDMCKALSHEIIISETRLLNKSGGKSDFSSP
ncbi:MAG: cyclic pyranopterin monophosphate synthase MoaC [Marinicella sp.]|nr:cyclic pyranopterin monophosphate synthase MoaC [Xanthomonadales bacterium]